MKARKEGKKKNLRAASAEPLPGKIITTTSGNVLKQYPAKSAITERSERKILVPKNSQPAYGHIFLRGMRQCQL